MAELTSIHFENCGVYFESFSDIDKFDDALHEEDEISYSVFAEMIIPKISSRVPIRIDFRDSLVHLFLIEILDRDYYDVVMDMDSGIFKFIYESIDHSLVVGHDNANEVSLREINEILLSGKEPTEYGLTVGDRS
ncbi:MAG: hypothetical protein AAGI71_00980 [Bacteroidota bacterium]